MTTQDDTVVKTKTKTRIQISPPSEYKVIYLNDEVTSMEFVVESLVSVFDYTDEIAHELTKKIHTDGAATVAILPYEIAEQKGIEVTVLARNNQYPLQITLEPAD